MSLRILFVTVLSILATVFCKVNEDTINSGIVNTKVERKIDIATHLVKIYTTITFENKGAGGVSQYLYVVDPTLRDSVSFIGAVIKGESTKLKVAKTTVAAHSDKDVWRIKLGSEVAAGKSATLEVEAIFTHALTPYPAQITQAERQYVVFNGNLYFYSPYKTASQTLTVQAATSAIESYTKTKPVSVSDSTISYGPFTDRDPFTEGELRVHEENNSPFLTVTSLERVIEVSHWGNIAVEEHVDMMHSGAELKGPFSRFDYQRNQDGVSSIKSFKTMLPASARDVYYRDEIGNISTSALRELDDAVEVELRPRFPLFGGWKTRYFLGYNVPSYEYLFNRGDDYALKMRLVDHIYDDMVVDEVVIRIILPEGTKNLDWHGPYAVQRRPDELHFTYLDTVGRPVVVLYKTNLVELHIQEFELHYNFQKLRLLQEPLLVVGAFYLLFLVVIIYVRLDFSITKDEAKESRMRVAGLIETIQSTQDKRSALYQSYEDAVNKYKTSKDSNAFSQSRKKVDGDYKLLTQQINALLSQVKGEGSDSAEKVTELQRLDNQYKEYISQSIIMAEKLVAGKLNKQQYLETEEALKGKMADIYLKMETVRASI